MHIPVRNHPPHMINSLVSILLYVLGRVFLKNLDNLSTAVVAYGFATPVVLLLARACRFGGLEPRFELGSCHVYDFVEVGNDIFLGLHGGGGFGMRQC